MTCGIYAIVCTGSWRSYVGQTVNLETRFQDHIQLLRRQKHDNTSLQIDFDIYGEDSFNYEVIEKNDEIKLGEREIYWIEFGENLYNKTSKSRQIFLTEKEKERFWSWVEIKTLDECWNWFGAADKDGYGRLGFRRDGKKRMFRANRVAYYIINPNDDINLIVRHRCNNPKCCNPNHLCIGSSKENALDKRDNEKNYKLNWEIVKDLRNKFIENPNILPKDINFWFFNTYKIKIPNGHIISICLNQKWFDKQYVPPNRNLRYYLTDTDKALIDTYIKNGIPPVEIYNKLNQEHNIPTTSSNVCRYIRNIKIGE